MTKKAAQPTPSDITNDDENTGDDTDELTYTAALDELEKILARIEANTTDIDSLAADVERSTVLIETCRTQIEKTRFTIETITADGPK